LNLYIYIYYVQYDIIRIVLEARSRNNLSFKIIGLELWKTYKVMLKMKLHSTYTHKMVSRIEK